MRYPLRTPMNRALPPLLFALAVVAHVALMVWLGNPWPGGLKSDGNVYLELASNLWRHGEYGTRVSVTYPPLYPMLIAPTFAIASNTARFAVIYALHALWLAAGSLLLWPMLRDALGNRQAWFALAAAQLLGGATIAAFHPQTETLFAALLTAATGLVYLCWKRSTPWRWLALGLVCGLALSTRRMALALPLALALLLALEAWSARGGQRSLPWLPAVFIGVGFALGLTPELVGSLLQGELIQPYDSDPVTGHLKAGAKAFAGPLRLLELVRVFGRHLAYLCVIGFGAPAIIVAALRARAWSDERVPQLGAAALFLALSALALVGMTTLHIVRYTFRGGIGTGWDLYPRYMDPLEIALVLVGLAAGTWLLRERGLAVAVPRVRYRTVLPWAATFAVLVIISGPLYRSRGGRLPSVEALDGWGFGPAAPWLFPLLTLIVLAAAVAWWSKGRWASVWTVVLAGVLSWGISTHSAIFRATANCAGVSPAIYETIPLQQAGPRAPVAVMVGQPGPNSRHYYEPAFRSDHPVDFIAPDEVQAWANEHPDGFVLVWSRDRAPKLKVVARASGWQAYSSWRAP